jgi:hypothetical protein
VRKAPPIGRKGGGHACAVCNHAEREQIEVTLVTPVPFGHPLLRTLSAKYGMSPASLSRHRSHHMGAKYTVVHPALPVDATTLQHLESAAARLESVIAEAERNGRVDQLVTLSRELRITRSDIAKAKGENGVVPAVVDLQRSAEWLAIRAVIYDVLAPHPALRVEIGKRLLELDGKKKT